MSELSGHNTYVIYDHANKKFYMLLLASKERYIAVAEDLTEMYSLLKEQAERSGQQPSTESEDDSIKDLSSLALRALEVLNQVGKGRFNMPWRWRQWSNNFQQVTSQWGINEALEDIPLSLQGGTSSEIRVKAEQRKK